MREARALHVHVPSDCWSCLSTVRGYLKIGRRIESSKLLTLVHQALMDLERAITKAKAMLQVTVEGTIRLLDGLKKSAENKLDRWKEEHPQWVFQELVNVSRCMYAQKLAMIRDTDRIPHPEAAGVRILLYWI